MEKWLLKKGEDRRLRSGHPWVFAGELLSSSKSILPGDIVEVRDFKGQFIARGYGNSQSQIVFRAVSFVESEKEILTKDFFISRLIRSWQVRSLSGLKYSFRLCYGEADGFPGLVIDLYVTKKGLVFAVQLLTAGMQKALTHQLQQILIDLTFKAKELGLTNCSESAISIILRNDVKIRKLEGLPVEDPKVILNTQENSLVDVEIALDTVGSDQPLWMSVDLEQGQKTGFFLDQRGNIFQVLEYLKKSQLPSIKNKKIRILDLCCYVGHWSTQLVKLLKTLGCQVEIHLLDISKEALTYAYKNVKKVTDENDIIEIHECDVLNSLDSFKDANFDIVIADPPAFIKAKKDIPTGSHAYLKLNTHAFRLTSYKGIVISCSCSGLMESDNFRDILRKAQFRQSLMLPTVVVGGHSPDHPIIMSFPEGIYLKMIAHLKI